jgi:hypothetical protein
MAPIPSAAAAVALQGATAARFGPGRLAIEGRHTHRGRSCTRWS